MSLPMVDEVVVTGESLPVDESNTVTGESVPVDVNENKTGAEKFLQIFKPTNLKDDPLPVKVHRCKISNDEAVGQGIQWAEEYLYRLGCPMGLLQCALRVVFDHLTERRTHISSSVKEENGVEELEPLSLMHDVVTVVDNFFQNMKHQQNADECDVALIRNNENEDICASNIGISHVSWYSMKNTRRTMEDKMAVYPSLPYVFNFNEKLSYFGVFDGHNGIEAASYVSAQMHQYFIKGLSANKILPDALKTAFEDIDAAFIAKCKAESIRSGTTATVVILQKDKLYIAWAGDCRTSLHFGNGQVKQLISDHKPDRVDEQTRVKDMGGEILEVNGMLRVNGTLAVTRSIGDPDFKGYVVSNPELIEIERSGELNEEYIVLASDGLWDSMTAVDVGNFVNEVVLNKGVSGGAEAAQLLASEAKSRGSVDNISIIIIYLQPLEDLALNLSKRSTITCSLFDGELGKYYDTYQRKFEITDKHINGMDNEPYSAVENDGLELKIEPSAPLVSDYKDDRESESSEDDEWSFHGHVPPLEPNDIVVEDLNRTPAEMSKGNKLEIHSAEFTSTKTQSEDGKKEGQGENDQLEFAEIKESTVREAEQDEKEIEIAQDDQGAQNDLRVVQQNATYEQVAVISHNLNIIPMEDKIHGVEADISGGIERSKVATEKQETQDTHVNDKNAPFVKKVSSSVITGKGHVEVADGEMEGKVRKVAPIKKALAPTGGQLKVKPNPPPTTSKPSTVGPGTLPTPVSSSLTTKPPPQKIIFPTLQPAKTLKPRSIATKPNPPAVAKSGSTTTKNVANPLLRKLPAGNSDQSKVQPSTKALPKNPSVNPSSMHPKTTAPPLSSITRPTPATTVPKAKATTITSKVNSTRPALTTAKTSTATGSPRPAGAGLKKLTSATNVSPAPPVVPNAPKLNPRPNAIPGNIKTNPTVAIPPRIPVNKIAPTRPRSSALKTGVTTTVTATAGKSTMPHTASRPDSSKTAPVKKPASTVLKPKPDEKSFKPASVPAQGNSLKAKNTQSLSAVASVKSTKNVKKIEVVQLGPSDIDLVPVSGHADLTVGNVELLAENGIGIDNISEHPVAPISNGFSETELLEMNSNVTNGNGIH